MDPKRQCLLVLAKMALQDGVVSDDERRTLEDMAGDLSDDEIDAIVLDAYQADLEELIAGVEKYEDRFIIAMRAYLMAHSDADYDLKEEASFERLVESFGLEEGDRLLIERLQGRISGLVDEGPDPRLLELHKGSSFYRGDF